MNAIDHCLIIDNNQGRTSILEKTIKEHQVASSVKLTLNCGHGLLYLKEMWEKMGERKTLVFINVNTPIMDGAEFMDELKLTPYFKSEKFMIVAMNDTINEKDKDVFIKKGISHFISSPFSYDTIYSLIGSKFEIRETPVIKEGKSPGPKKSNRQNKPLNNSI